MSMHHPSQRRKPLDTIRLIEAAFEGVTLGSGVSLRETDVLDSYGGDEERAAARQRDELTDWRRIPDGDIDRRDYALCFMDEESLRFHLPAYMRFALRRHLDTELSAPNSTLYQLCDPECVQRLVAFFTDRQVEAVRAFLITCLDIGDDYLDVSGVPSALPRWRPGLGSTESPTDPESAG
ncbi:MAG: DUF6714 family protein [Acidobacteriota bacterium]